MNYPVWEVVFGSRWIIAVIGVIHVFIAQFAVGGGLFLVLTEGRARKSEDPALLEWLKKHTRFFAFLTLVFGATTGVGIWFTIGLISPEATSHLIHLFVWVWAIEWVFFLVEILAIIVYSRTWVSRVSRRQHMLIGWIYFAAAYLSLVAINGILAFQLTPGRWLTDHSLLSAFFNPSYWSQLIVRSLICVVLAGLYALVTVSWSKDRILKAEVAKYAGTWAWSAAILLLPAGYWFVRSLPKANEDLVGLIASVRQASLLFLGATALVAVLVLVVSTVWPRLLGKPYALVLLFMGLCVVGSTEWVRESVRKPYTITDYLYINHVAVTDLARDRKEGMLAASLWVGEKTITPSNEAAAGKELFRIACSACHNAVSGSNAVAPRLKGLDAAFVGGLVYRTDLMRGGMPPFPGTQREAQAVARYLSEKIPGGGVPSDGASVWARRCGPCHTLAGSFRPVGSFFKGQKPDDVAAVIEAIHSVNEEMPPWSGSQAEEKTLAEFLAAQGGGAK